MSFQIIIADDNERAVWQARYDAALSVRHDVALGKSMQSLGYNGEQVTWHVADLDKLDLYISRMQAALGLIKPRRNRSRGFRFG